MRLGLHRAVLEARQMRSANQHRRDHLITVIGSIPRTPGGRLTGLMAGLPEVRQAQVYLERRDGLPKRSSPRVGGFPPTARGHRSNFAPCARALNLPVV